ncbi:UNVERIFIED_CONTAM: hypothetical protein FKN15_051130 [Acipenser sinensis]
MQVETMDLSGKTLEGPVDVEVAIIDQNDNRPVFKGGPHVGEILEGSPTDAVGPYPNYLRDILHSHMCQQLSMRQSSCEHESDSSQTVSPETLCSSLCSLEDHPLLKDLGSPTDLATKLFGAIHGGEEILAKLQRGRESAFRNLGQLICNDSSYSVSYTESCFSPEDEEDMPCKDYESVCKEDSGYEVRRKVSDVASSGVVSLDDEEEEEEENEDV